MGRLADRTVIRMRVRLGKYRSVAWPLAQGVADLAKEAIREQISIEDHTLKELRKLGHPYRVDVWGNPPRKGPSVSYARVTKKGSFQTGIQQGKRLEREGALGHDIKLVHKQSGDLLDALFSTRRREGASTVRAIAGVDPNAITDYDPIWLITGTRKMIGRDFILAAKIALRAKLAAYLKEEANKLIRQIAHGGFSFPGSGTSDF